MLGPGIITAALILGPGTLTVASKLGSQYQYQLVWVILFSTIFMIAFTIMSARHGFYIKNTLIGSIRIRHGKLSSWLVGFSIFIISVSFQSGNSIGAGLAIGSLSGTGPDHWIMAFTLIAIALLFFRSFYKILEKTMILLVLVMMVSFFITAIITVPDLRSVAKGFIPKIPEGSELLSIAIVATSCSIAGAFYQSYLVQQKTWITADFRTCRLESITGILLLGFISTLVLIAAGSVLFVNNITVNTVADMGLALEPLFGSASYGIFMIGLFAASFSSLIGNATLGGNILADTLNIGKSSEQWSTRIIIMILIIAGSLIAIAFSGFRLKLIVFAQAFTILVVPAVALILLRITNDNALMDEHRNSPIIRMLGILGVLLLTGLAIAYVYIMYISD